MKLIELIVSETSANYVMGKWGFTRRMENVKIVPIFSFWRYNTKASPPPPPPNKV